MPSTLRLKLRPSWRLAALLLVLHGAALGALWLLTFPLWARLSVIAALVASLVHALRDRALLLGGAAVVELDCGEDGALGFVQRDGTCLDAEVLPASAVHAGAVLLRVRAAGERRARSIVVLADSLEPEDFRLLRVWLRWRRRLSAG
jgi:toxin CptA